MADHKFEETVHETVVLGVGVFAQLVKREKKKFHSFTHDPGPEFYENFHLLIVKNGTQVRLRQPTAIKDLSAFISRTPPPLFKLDGWYFERTGEGLRIFCTGSSPFVHGTLIDLTAEEVKALSVPLLTWNFLVGETNKVDWA